MTGFATAFVAAFFWASFDAARKFLGDRHSALSLLALLHLVQIPLFAGWLVIDGLPLPQNGYWLWGAGVLTLNLSANGLFIASLQRAPLSVTIPMLSLTPALTALLGIPLLNELPTPMQWSGIAMVVVGAVWLALLRGKEDTESSLIARMKKEPGVLMMAAVALLWSLTGPLDKRALEYAEVSFHASLQISGIGLLTTLWLAGAGRLDELWVKGRELLGVAGGGLVGATAYGLQLLAFQLVFVSLVEAIKRAIGMTSALVVGRVAFDESLSASKVLAVLTMMAGSALLLL